ncbi:FAD-binding protein [Spirillospora sp. NPDC047279]|uniref:FAD-binding oxidoreductase n=1 Tax=Spirillospora sp. NPDC047279 TaxID=3155478 RepID=UPI0034104A59
MTRRGFIRGTAAAGTVGLVAGTPVAYAAGAEAGTGTAAGAGAGAAGACQPTPGTVVVGPKDPRYGELTARGFNGRFSSRPESVRLVYSADQVVHEVEAAVRAGKRVAVRSGGHCFENFVDDPAVTVLLDISEMNAVYYDRRRRAFAVEAGATLGKVYRTLYLGWGVTVPAGACPSVGTGGHIAGGGYGSLSRREGLVVDHLYAVEVVVADRSGRARTVVATREPGDPNRDLWWAFTGAGGGNFGIVTRYWMRSPGATGDDPGSLLPRPPAVVKSMSVGWQWSDLDERTFTTIVGNFGSLLERDSAPGERFAAVECGVSLSHKVTGQIRLDASVDGGRADADELLGAYLKAVTRDVTAPHSDDRLTMPWMKSTLSVEVGPGGYSFKTKHAFHRTPFSARQIAAIYRHQSTGGEERYGGAVYLAGFGGKVNTVAPGATAMPHRNALMSAYYETVWWDPAHDDEQLGWIRGLYKEVYADSGGVPAPNADTDGAFINYPDRDLADPKLNASGVPWHTLYFKDNYARLQAVKDRWDPRDVFHHGLSIKPTVRSPR